MIKKIEHFNRYLSLIKHDKKEKGFKSREYGQFRGLQTLLSIDFVENSVHKND